MTLTAVVFGEAETQGSKRAFIPKGGRRPVLVEDNKDLKPWRSQLQAEMREALNGAELPFGRGSPVQVQLLVFVQRPAAHYGTGRNAGKLKESAPAIPAGERKDLDKIARAVGDAGTGIWWLDDHQISAWFARRRYAEDGRIRTEVRARLDEVPEPRRTLSEAVEQARGGPAPTPRVGFA